MRTGSTDGRLLFDPFARGDAPGAGDAQRRRASMTAPGKCWRPGCARAAAGGGGRQIAAEEAELEAAIEQMEAEWHGPRTTASGGRMLRRPCRRARSSEPAGEPRRGPMARAVANAARARSWPWSPRRSARAAGCVVTRLEEQVIPPLNGQSEAQIPRAERRRSVKAKDGNLRPAPTAVRRMPTCPMFTGASRRFIVHCGRPARSSSISAALSLSDSDQQRRAALRHRAR